MRIKAIDFWRGAILLVIMVDHVPGNGLEDFTPRNFGLSDSAEAFVFLSGLSVGAAYYGRSLRDGVGPVARACLARSLAIYRVHLAMSLAALAIFGAAFWMSGLPDLMAEHGRGLLLEQPASALAGLAAMTHQLGYFNILPMYVVLMAMSAPIFALARLGLGWALAASAAIYALVRLTSLNLPSWPQPGGWFFDPLAWQFVFTLGLCAAIAWRDRAPRASALGLGIAAAIVIAGAVVVSDAFGLAPELRDRAFPYLDAGKQYLGLGRLISFAALAYLVWRSSLLRRLAESAGAEPLRRLGRNSLAIFAIGSLLAALGQALTPLAALHAAPALVKFSLMLYTLACLGVLILLAKWIESRESRAGGRFAAALFELRSLAQGWRLAFARRAEMPLSR